MVILVVKRGDEDPFIYETNVNESSGPVICDITAIYNGRLKVYRICRELEELCEHGTMLPPDMMGLTDEQIEDLKLVDVWATQCVPSGGFVFNKDTLGRRNGQQPQENMRNVLENAIIYAKELFNKKFILARKPLTLKIIEEALNLLRGAVTIVYPMQLPPHDTIRMEFMNTEDLSDSQVSREVIEPSKAQLWFAGRQVLPDSKLRDFFGANDKTEVIVNLNSYGEGPPVFAEDVGRCIMADVYRREEELKIQPEMSNTTQLTSVDTSVTEEDINGVQGREDPIADDASENLQTSPHSNVTYLTPCEMGIDPSFQSVPKDDFPIEPLENSKVLRPCAKTDLAAGDKDDVSESRDMGNKMPPSPVYEEDVDKDAAKNKLKSDNKCTELLQPLRPFKEIDLTASDMSSTASSCTIDESFTKGNVYDKYDSIDEWQVRHTDLVGRDKSSASSIDTVTESVCKDLVCQTREHKPQLEGEETTSACSDIPIHLALFIKSMLDGDGTGLKGEKFMDKLNQLRNYLEADIMACDAKWTLFVAAAHDYRYRELLKPFPPRYIHDTSHKPMIYPVQLVIIKTSQLNLILEDIREKNYEHLNAAVIDLLHYVLVGQSDLMLHTLTQANVECLLSTLGQGSKAPRPSHAFKTIMLGDQSVKNFESPKWAFYANNLVNFYSIFTQSALQEPLLLNSNLENSLKMSSKDHGWGGSNCGSMISCVAVCEFDNIKEYVTCSKDDSVIKVAKKDLVRPRYLLFYGNRLTEHDGLVDIRPQTTWMGRLRSKIPAAVAIVLAAAITINTPVGVVEYCTEMLKSLFTWLNALISGTTGWN